MVYTETSGELFLRGTDYIFGINVGMLGHFFLVLLSITRSPAMFDNGGNNAVTNHTSPLSSFFLDNTRRYALRMRINSSATTPLLFD